MSVITHRCRLSFFPKKVEFDPANYQDESKLLFPPHPSWLSWMHETLTLANRRWVTYLRDEDARTKHEVHDVPEHVLLDAKAGQMSQETVEWATKMLERPGVVVVSIEQEEDKGAYKGIRYFTIVRNADGGAFVCSN